MKINLFILRYYSLLLLLLTSCQSKVDLIVHNANVYTMSQKTPSATALCCSDGKFIDVGG